MPVYASRKFRNTAAVLMLASGISHVAQLWFSEIDAFHLLEGLLGMYYLLLSLGLSGRSRFTLWITSISVIANAGFGLSRWLPDQPDLLLAWHILADALVALLCLYILYRTRYASMD